MKKSIYVAMLGLFILSAQANASIFDIGSSDFIPFVATGMESALMGVKTHPDKKDSLGKTALFYAVIFNKAKAVKEILDVGADVSIASLTDNEGNFALDVANAEVFELVKNARQKQLNIATDKPFSGVQEILKLNTEAKIKELKK